MTIIIALLGLRGLGFAQPITLDAKDALLTEVAATIAKQTKLKITVDPACSNDKVTVLVKDMPAKDLLDRLASLYDLDGAVKEESYSFKISAKQMKSYASYLDAEQTLRITQVHAKIDALAQLTLLSPEQRPEAKKADLAMKWALAHIDRPEYYALGLWERGTIIKAHGNVKLANWYSYLMDGPGCNFWVGEPPQDDHSKRVQRIPGPAEAFADEHSGSALGSAIQIAAYRTTGEIDLKAIRNIRITPDDPPYDRPFADAVPPKELSKTPFALALANWQIPVPDKALKTTNIDFDAPPDPGYYNQKISLTQKLEYLHGVSGVPIIATSFRTPALEQSYPSSSSPREILEDLRTKEQAIVRWDDGCLMVRHPGYWLLECTEPLEGVMRAAEEFVKTRPLNLYDYVCLAALTSQHSDAVPRWQMQQDGVGANSTKFPRCFERLIDDRAFLSRFDPGPLEKSYPILMVLASMHDNELDALFQGEKLDSWALNYGVSFTRLFKSAIPTGITDTGKKLPSGQEIWHQHRRWYADGWAGSVGEGTIQQTSDLADVAADFAPLFSAPIPDDGYLTRWELIGGSHEHVSRFKMVRPEEIDPLNNIGNETEDQRARFIWVQSSSETSYRICVGYPDNTVATYDIEIGFERSGGNP